MTCYVEKWCATSLFVFVFLVFFLILGFLIDGNPIVADGYQNLTAAKNILEHSIFSSVETDGIAPTPDMLREPTWPFLTAFFISISSLDFPIAVLASEFFSHFKLLNLSVYALSSSIASCWIYLETRKVTFGFLGLFLFLLIYGSTPRLINNFNNEALATLFLLVSSILFYKAVKAARGGGSVVSALLGLMLGLLALTKAQFLYISIPLVLALFFFNKKNSTLALLAFSIVVLPWIFRNHELFNEPAIAKRGMTVASVRVMLTSEPTFEERLCMTYAFTHPFLQHYLEKPLGISSIDFVRGAKCQRLNRETCFDMGTKKVQCTAFPEDQGASDYSSKIQLFYKGFHAGQQIERGNLAFGDIFNLNSEFFIKYIKTLPLFAWRGMGFSDYPLIAILLSISPIILLATRYWSFSLLCVSSWLFHIALTHNIPRYHATLFPAMIVSLLFLFHLLLIKYKLILVAKTRLEDDGIKS